MAMDLFDDLPEPAVNKKSVIEEVLPEKKFPNDQSDGSNFKRKVEENSLPENRQYKRKSLEEGTFLLKSYVKERRGEREEMQDAHNVVEMLDREIPHLHCSVYRLSYYGVFDGHAGSRASQYAAKHLHQNIAAKFPKGDIDNIEKEIKKCFIDAYKKTDDDFLKEAARGKPTWKDGTTAVTVTVINNVLFIANLGDSKAVLARHNDENESIVAIPLTIDHTPTKYEERMRIQRAGGHVRNGRVMGILEVSRSIGDGQFKTCGISCIPDVKRCQIVKNDRFIILACDGLWKVFTPSSAVAFVNDILQDKTICATETMSELEAHYEIACLKLANEAVRRGSGDNITVLLISISQPL